MSTYSNWREDLIEVIDTPTTEKKDDKKIKETKINNKVIINPTFKEAVAEMGGEIVEMAEVEDSKEKAKEIKADKEVKSKEKRVGLAKKMILQKKVQAVRQGAGADITASYEPVGPVLESVMKMIKRVVKKKPEKKAQKAMDAGAIARRKLQQKDHASVNFLPMDEAKVDTGRSDYGKASIRNYRRSGPGHGEPAMFDSENKRGKTIDKRREEHKARRGVKGAKVPAYKVEEGVKGEDNVMRKIATQDRAAGKDKRLSKKEGEKNVANMMNKIKMSPGYNVNEEDKALNYVLNKIKNEVGKSGYISKNNPRKPQSAADKAKVRAHQAKVDAENAAERKKDPSQGRYPKG